MKRFLLFPLLLLTLVACSDTTGSSEKKSSASTWKVTLKQGPFTFLPDSSYSYSSGNVTASPDSLYLRISGDTIQLFTVRDDSSFSILNMITKTGKYPRFSILNPESADQSFASGTPNYLKVNGRVLGYENGFSLFYYETDSTGKIGVVELQETTMTLPDPKWVTSSTTLTADWKSVFRF